MVYIYKNKLSTWQFSVPRVGWWIKWPLQRLHWWPPTELGDEKVTLNRLVLRSIKASHPTSHGSASHTECIKAKHIQSLRWGTWHGFCYQNKLKLLQRSPRYSSWDMFVLFHFWIHSQIRGWWPWRCKLHKWDQRSGSPNALVVLYLPGIPTCHLADEKTPLEENP